MVIMPLNYVAKGRSTPMFEDTRAVLRSQSCRLRTRGAGLATTSLVLASFGALTVVAPSAMANPRPGLVTAAARHLSSAASCPVVVVKLTTEDYYGVPSATNTSGTGVADYFKSYSA